VAVLCLRLEQRPWKWSASEETPQGRIIWSALDKHQPGVRIGKRAVKSGRISGPGTSLERAKRVVLPCRDERTVAVHRRDHAAQAVFQWKCDGARCVLRACARLKGRNEPPRRAARPLDQHVWQWIV